ncbi:YvbH-like oligomerization domain-containing protein [Neobacillus niacini]
MINQAAFQWLEESKKQYNVNAFGHVFEKYFNN